MLKLSNGHSQHSEFGECFCVSGVCVCVCVCEWCVYVCVLMAGRLLSFFFVFVVVLTVLGLNLLFFSPLGVV